MALLGVLSLISVCKISLVSNSRTLQKRSSLREVSVGGFFSCPRSSSRQKPLDSLEFQRFEFQLPQLLLILKQDVEGRTAHRSVTEK